MANLSIAKIKTRDGRTISYRKIGIGPRKILFFHGFPGSSAQVELFNSCLIEKEMSVIAIDRPGYNHTSPAVDLQIRQTGFDAIAVTMTEGWNEFEIFGVSGGCPFAFWFIEHFPKHVQKFHIVSGLGPVFAPGFERFIPNSSRVALTILRYVPSWLMKKAGPKEQGNQRPLILQKFFKLAPADELCLKDPAAIEVMSQAVREAFKQSGLGAQADAGAYLQPWPFRLETYRGPIEIWHGDQDLILPFEMAVQTATLLPRARLHIVEGEGHFSLSMNHVDRII